MDFRIRSHSCATNTSNIKLPPLPRITEKQAEKLGLYVGLASRPVPIEHLPKQEYQPPYFFIEITPESTTICAYTNCSSRILVGDYRLAMCPGMSQESMLVKSTGSDYYHIECFEMIADLNEPCFYERIFPLTRNTFRYRYVHYQELAAGKYVCDGGAERLVQEWRYKKWEMNQHSKRFPQERRPQDAMENIAYNAGSSRFVYHPVPGINMWEVNCYIRPLAPNESDGSGDLNEWNLFDSFLYPKPAVKSEQGYFSDRHCLSKVLREWRDAKVSCQPLPILSEEENFSRTHPRNKAMRGVVRLSRLPPMII